MTAINIVCLGNAVHMISDGASTNADGRIAGIAPKVFALPHIKSVIGVRGSSAAATIFAHTAGFCSNSFDELKLQIVNVFKQGLEHHRDLFERSPGKHEIELHIAGFSAALGPAAYVISNFDRGDSVAFAITEIPSPGLSFAPSGTEYEALDAYCEAYKAKFFDLERFSVVVMCEQRRVVMSRPPQAAGAVGGFIQLTSVSEEEIATRIVHRWHDKVGDNLFRS
jgi:hypothetical protein